MTYRQGIEDADDLQTQSFPNTTPGHLEVELPGGFLKLHCNALRIQKQKNQEL